jgi:Ubinuclein conserved middle domain
LTIPFLDKRQEKLRTEAAEASAGTGSAGPTRHPTEEMDVDGNGNQPLATVGASGDPEGGKDGKDGKDHGQHPPAKRYRLTDVMKSMVWELVLLSNECCRLENEKKLVFHKFVFC